MSTSSYANTLLKKNNLKKKHSSYRIQAEQSLRERKKQSGKEKVVIPYISPHFEDCPIGEAEKDIILGKLLEDRAFEISNVAQEIHDIQKEQHRVFHYSKANENEQCNLHHPRSKEIEERKRELNHIEEEILEILKSRDNERSLKNLSNKGNNLPNSHMRSDGDIFEEDSQSANEHIFRGPLQYSCKQINNTSIADDDLDLFEEDEEDVKETIDVEDEISFIEGLIEEDILGSRHPTLGLSHPLEEGENRNLISKLKQQNSDIETDHFVMKKLLQDIENDFD